MKIERKTVNAITVTWPEGQVRTYLEKQSLLDTLDNRANGNRSCIEHAEKMVAAYQADIAKYKAELAANLEYIKQAEALEPTDG